MTEVSSFIIRKMPPHRLTGNFSELDKQRDCFHFDYAELLKSDPRLRGQVLDVGCGDDHPAVTTLREVLTNASRVDGVDPLASIANHPYLTSRWCAPFETADIPERAYDSIFTFWVVEHISNPLLFMEQSARVLKPGGRVYALTASSLHPFAWISRSVQSLNLKARWRRISRAKVNDYPAYYRLNRPGRIAKFAQIAGFTEVEIWRIPCRQWDIYFPAALRFAPTLYDRLVGCQFQIAAQVLMFRATMPGEWADESRATAAT